MIIDYSGLLIQEFILSHAKIDKGMGRCKQPGSFQALVGKMQVDVLWDLGQLSYGGIFAQQNQEAKGRRQVTALLFQSPRSIPGVRFLSYLCMRILRVVVH